MNDNTTDNTTVWQNGFAIEIVHKDGCPQDVRIYIAFPLLNPSQKEYVRNVERATIFGVVEDAYKALDITKFTEEQIKGKIAIVSPVVYNEREHEEYWNVRKALLQEEKEVKEDWSAIYENLANHLKTLHKDLLRGEYDVGLVRLKNAQVVYTDLMINIAKHTK